MTRYWVIAPYEANPSDVFDKVWRFDVENGVISIGWQELGDVSGATREALAAKVAATYPSKPRATQTLYANMLWNFFHEIVPGDFIVARRGRKMLAGIGTVTQRATFAPRHNPHAGHANFLRIAWQEQPRDKSFSEIVFPMHTLAEFSEPAYLALLTGSPAPSVAGPPVEDPSEFVLEKYLEDFIVSNFDGIFKGQLRIYQDADGNSGQQYTTDIGPIDILAIEPNTNSIVVIELKKGRPSDQVVGQILRYMGWVSENICGSDQSVKGMVICREPDIKLSYALKLVQAISVQYYKVSFRLSAAP